MRVRKSVVSVLSRRSEIYLRRESEIDDKKTLRGLLSGHYIWFDSTSGGTYNAWVVDLNLIKKIYKQEDRETELFMTGHNLFDGYQYFSHNYFNAKRWAEAGILSKWPGSAVPRKPPFF